MVSWLMARAVGWDALSLAHAVAAVRDEPESFRSTLFCEAALTHQRCLIEFLLGRPDRKGVRRWKASDVTPAAIFDGWDPEDALPGETVRVLTAALRDIDSLLAHVSLRRVEIARRTWPLGSLTREVLAAFEVFVERLRVVEPFRADCLQAWLAAAREHLSERGVDLEACPDVTPSSSVLFMTPMGESAGRAAALMARADADEWPAAGYGPS